MNAPFTAHLPPLEACAVLDAYDESQEMAKEERFHTLLAGGYVEDSGTRRLDISFGEMIPRMSWDEQTDELQRIACKARHDGDHERMLAASVKLWDWMIEQTRNLA